MTPNAVRFSISNSFRIRIRIRIRISIRIRIRVRIPRSVRHIAAGGGQWIGRITDLGVPVAVTDRHTGAPPAAASTKAGAATAVANYYGRSLKKKEEKQKRGGNSASSAPSYRAIELSNYRSIDLYMVYRIVWIVDADRATFGQ